MNGFFRKIPAFKKQDRKWKVIVRNRMGTKSGHDFAGDGVTDTPREDSLLLHSCHPLLILQREGSHSAEKGLGAPESRMQGAAGRQWSCQASEHSASCFSI